MQVKEYKPLIVAFCCNWCSYAGAALERAQNKHRIDSAGARNTNDLDICRVREAVVACEVSACV